MATFGSCPGPDGEPSRVAPQGRDVDEHREAPAIRAVPTRPTAAVVLLTGLWVAISPGFLPLRPGGANAAADVIIGLLVVCIATLAVVGQRPGPRFTSLVLSVWVVLISSFMLDERVSIPAPVYWSNTWSGVVLAVLALAALRPGWRQRHQITARKSRYAGGLKDHTSPVPAAGPRHLRMPHT